MRITFTRQEFLAALRWTGRAPAGGRGPMAGQVLIAAPQSGPRAEVAFTAHADDATWWRHTAAARVFRPGGVTVEADLLREIAAALPAAPLTLTVHAATVVLTAGAVRYALPALPSREPYTPGADAPGACVVTVGTAAFAGAVSRVAPAAATGERDGDLAVLGGVHLAARDDELRLQATNRYRLAIETIACEAAGDSGLDAVAPARWMAALAAGLPGELARIHTDGRMLTVTSSHRACAARLLAGGYLQVGQYVPEQATTRAETDRRELLAMLERAAFVHDPHNNPVVLDIGRDRIGMTAADGGTGRLEDGVPAGVRGRKLVVGVNAALLKQAVLATPGQTVTLHFEGARNPLKVTGSGPERVLHVLAPRQPAPHQAATQETGETEEPAAA
ncbi:hypothetical protein [Bailinhaonella thermotolerans]|uniref:DNA polymerase III subunit beta n=1 Tax=Bailinhaonella thermotolerans TaxID=1070861 RepID=A0A3A4AEC9_9ACTN|nr:hypothetical protein [Bailinhaonella thermotolerans]RJL24003.1 hypothetical protein D5H75_31750 [Bailinhaonella thermotolerans]